LEVKGTIKMIFWLVKSIGGLIFNYTLQLDVICFLQLIYVLYHTHSYLCYFRSFGSADEFFTGDGSPAAVHRLLTGMHIIVYNTSNVTVIVM